VIGIWYDDGFGFSDLDRIMFWAKFSDQDRIRILFKFFGADRIIKFQYPHNTAEYRLEVFGLWFSWVLIQSCFANFESNPDPVPTTIQAIRIPFESG